MLRIDEVLSLDFDCIDYQGGDGECLAALLLFLP